MNAEKSKVIVGSSDGKMIVNSVHSMYTVDSQVVYVVTCRW